jgi:hypothetical protein
MANNKKAKPAARRRRRKKHHRYGYLDQLNRARRFLKRMKDANRSGEEFQDMAWAFYQNCWHVTDWLVNDLRLGDRTHRKRFKDLAKASIPLTICRALCDGTKHKNFDLNNKGAPSHYIAYTMHLSPLGASGEKPNEIDFVIHNAVGFASGTKLADECIAEWERILKSEGLATG